MTAFGVDPAFHERFSRALGPGFELLGLRGRGGFADVYEIRDCQLQRTLAAKVLRPEVAWEPWMISRFEREARALASLNHLNIPPVHFVGDNEGLVYYVMPLIEGRSLGDMLAESGPIEPAFLVEVMIPVLEALQHAHGAGIVHRDIKPDNIIVEKGTGRPLLVDFGVAKQVETGATGTSVPGVILGTPGYISPEQALALSDVDARSDVYAVGATMFHLLTGTTTFHGDTVREIIGRQMTGEIPVPALLNERIPGWLSEAIVRALSTRREDRFQSASAMAEALRAGPRSGARLPDRVIEAVERIRDDDPTPQMVRTAATNGSAAILPARRHPANRRIRDRGGDPAPSRASSYFSWTLLLGLAGSAGAYFALVPVTFVLRNELLLPLEVSTDDGAVGTIPAGGSLSLPLPSDGKVVARWFIVQPRSDSQQPAMGEAISGVMRVDVLSAVELLLRRVARSVDSWADGQVAFAPRLHNGTSEPLRVTVNRLRGASNCACTIRPGETRVLGYYRLDPNSFVLVENGRRESVVFRNLESRIDLNTGVLDLNVTDTILSRSP